jgi:hypothetical protein
VPLNRSVGLCNLSTFWWLADDITVRQMVRQNLHDHHHNITLAIASRERVLSLVASYCLHRHAFPCVGGISSTSTKNYFALLCGSACPSTEGGHRFFSIAVTVSLS